MNEFLSPLLCPEIIKAHNYLNVQHGVTSQELWRKAQQWCLGFASYCSENGLPPRAICFYYDVRKQCETHEQAAFWAAANVVSAYIDAGMGGDI